MTNYLVLPLSFRLCVFSIILEEDEFGRKFLKLGASEKYPVYSTLHVDYIVLSTLRLPSNMLIGWHLLKNIAPNNSRYQKLTQY